MGGDIYKYRLLFVGGDNRQLRAANRTAENGVQVTALGFSDLHAGNISRIDDINDREFDYTAVVLPLPYSIDGVNINAPELQKKLNVSEVIQKLPRGCCILAGKCDVALRKLAEGKNITLVDYFDREALQPHQLNLLGIIYEKAIVTGRKEKPSGALELTLIQRGQSRSLCRKHRSLCILRNV